jgi:hypothetical protein
MRSMIWSVVLIQVKGRAPSFQSLIHSSSAMVGSPREQNLSITECDAVGELAGIRPVADGPGQP